MKLITCSCEWGFIIHKRKQVYGPLYEHSQPEIMSWKTFVEAYGDCAHYINIRIPEKKKIKRKRIK